MKAGGHPITSPHSPQVSTHRIAHRDPLPPVPTSPPELLSQAREGPRGARGQGPGLRQLQWRVGSGGPCGHRRQVQGGTVKPGEKGLASGIPARPLCSCSQGPSLAAVTHAAALPSAGVSQNRPPLGQETLGGLVGGQVASPHLTPPDRDIHARWGAARGERGCSHLGWKAS